VYLCLLCAAEAPFTAHQAADFRQHAAEAHGITVDEMRGATGRMASHMDATDWHQTDDRFTLADGRPLLLRSYRARRRGADRRLWEANTGKGRGRGRR
jgi:hypothetical protein